MAKRLVQGAAAPVWIVDEDGNPVDWSGIGGGGGSIVATVIQGAPGIAAWLVQLAAGEAHAGQVGGKVVTVAGNPVLTVAGAYIANDFVGTSATAITFAGVARIAGGSGVIESAILIDKAGQSASCELWLFDTAPAGLPADNAPFSITDADALTCIGVIQFSSYFASALNSVSVGSFEKPIAFTCLAGSTSIYGVLVTRGTPTYASLDLMARLNVMQD